jgi:hypothetical protein
MSEGGRKGNDQNVRSAMGDDEGRGGWGDHGRSDLPAARSGFNQADRLGVYEVMMDPLPAQREAR